MAETSPPAAEAPRAQDAPPGAGRRAAEMERWRRRSSRIAFYRRALPWSMLIIVIAVAGWVGLRAFLSARQADVATSAIHMTNPKFYGRDQQGRSFQLSAKDAVRNGANANLVNLNQPGMVLENNVKGPVLVNGGHGLYHEDTKILLLDSGVRFRDGHGSDFHSTTATVDTQASTVQGQNNVTGRGPLGQIAASSYAVQDGGAHVMFYGDVRTHIVQTHSAATKETTAR